MPEQYPNNTLTECCDSLPPAARQGYGLTVCLLWNRLLIHRKTIRALGNPQRVRLLINPDTRHFCVQGCDEKEACSFPVPREMAPVYDPFYIHSKFLLGQIYEMMAWTPSLSYRVFGKINTNTQVMDFDLSRYVQVHGDEHLENDEVPEEFMPDYQCLTTEDEPGARQEETVIAPEAPGTKPEGSPPPSPGPVPVPTIPGRASLTGPSGFMGSLFDSVQLPRGTERQ